MKQAVNPAAVKGVGCPICGGPVVIGALSVPGMPYGVSAPVYVCHECYRKGQSGLVVAQPGQVPFTTKDGKA